MVDASGHLALAQIIRNMRKIRQIRKCGHTKMVKKMPYFGRESDVFLEFLRLKDSYKKL
jgi:hypothetical protein